MNSMFRVILVAALTLCAGTSAFAQPGPSGDPFLCYKAKSLGAREGLPRFTARNGDVAIDVFSTARPDDQHRIDLVKSIGLCAPASLNGDEVGDEVTHLESYGMALTRTTPRQPRHLDSVNAVVNVFGTLRLKVRAEDRLLVPTAKALGTGGVPPLAPSGVDHFKCYDAKVAKAKTGAPPNPVFVPVQVTIADQFGTALFNVIRPRRLCAPTDFAGTDPAAPTHPGYLVCYQVRLASTRPKQPKFVAIEVSTHTEFGPEALRVRSAEELCVPSFKDPAQATPVPTVTPTPTVGGTPGGVLAIHISPDTRYVNPGGTATFTATADLVGGGTADYAQKVIWTSSNPDVALAKNTDGDRNRIEAVSPGVATISVTDPVSGVTSTSSGDDATFNVTGALLSIALSPAAPAFGVGEGKSFAAIGSYEGGVTRNLTQRLSYTSSDPSVAVATNLDGNKSRVEGVALGTATISAVDPVTGVSSADSDGDAVVTVLGALTSITLSPTEKTRPAGQSQNYVATGHYDGGGTLNITQDVTYASSDPNVATAPNTPGNKGRIEAVAPGTATISASHPSGITTTAGGNDAVLTVTETLTLLSITLSPATSTHNVDDVFYFTATGHYTGGSTQNLTQDVVYSSSDPSVVSATNEAGARSKVAVLAPGTAVITATDPVTHISTTDSGDDATVTVLGPLLTITLAPAQATRAANQVIMYTATGHFEGGTTKNLTQRVNYTSSVPSVASAPNEAGNKSKVLTLAAGTTTISATDPVTGVSTTTSGDDATLTVTGALESITLSPVTSTRAPGTIQHYTATGHFAGGTTQNLTQSVVYASSDPSVAAAPNIDGDRSRVDAIAPGTVTISATDSTTGISTTDTNADATLTVAP